MPDDSPELKVLRQDSDPSIAATASMKARNREQTVFLMDPLEAPRKLSPRKKKEEAAHDAIVNLYLKTIPSPRQFAIFWNRRVEISYNSIMGENSVEFITGEVVEKYLNERLSLEAEWNLQTLRGKIEPVYIKIGDTEIAMRLRLALAIADDCLNMEGAEELALALYDIPFPESRASLIEHAFQNFQSSVPPEFLRNAWQTGDIRIKTALLNNFLFMDALTDAQAEEILAINSPLMLRPIAEKLRYFFEEKHDNLSDDTLSRLTEACARSKDPRVRKTLEENLDGIPDEIREKYGLDES